MVGEETVNEKERNQVTDIVLNFCETLQQKCQTAPATK
jgi:hypothetical protein